jgi:hypothetical protein
MILKYELIPEGDMFRLKALRDFGNVQKGDLGGLVKGEHNLSHEGHCWVYGNARVSGNAGVYGDARVYGDADVTQCLYVQQPKHGITVTDDHIFIGCEGHTWQFWNENGVAIGKKQGYSAKKIKDTKALLIILCNQINDMKRATLTPT